MRRTCDDWGGGITIGGRKICNLRYTDDTTLLAATEADIITYIDRMIRISTELGLCINRSKTKIMIVDRTDKLELTGNLDLEVVANFIYLGANINNNGSCKNEIRRRIGMANGMVQFYTIWKDKNICLKTKSNLVRNLVFSIFLYGVETCTLEKVDRDRIDAFEMLCWRKMLGIHWIAHRTNVSIHKNSRYRQGFLPSACVDPRILRPYCQK
ncbi:unnamed protein product [Euphydryas editha]|uniref:Reverse transcriptase domain-containing protein n=1 Tax=Euphydryas editha TaxID=104508 RepID=A0AAU9V9J4_EUPED|nr:unnamed protein product [Euphydryas editha]